MSQRLISRSQDLKRLRDEGFDIEVRSGYLLIKDVPYVNSAGEIKRGILVSQLTTAGDRTGAPETHVAMFAGEHPCDKDGRELAQIRHQSGSQRLADDLVVDHSFSSKPVGGRAYDDYYEKMNAYVAILVGPARAIDPDMSAQTFPAFTPDEDDSVFHYVDTATSRAGIGLANEKLALGKVAIIGAGGTGSYVLDLVAKTPVKELHLFDGDDFLSHNAFRAPGASSVEQLEAKPKKVAHLRDLYSDMRRGIVAHDYFIDASNVTELQGMEFVFLCIDAGESKRVIVENLETFNIAFIDVGMGVELIGDALRGALRVTTSTPQQRDHFRGRVSLADTGLAEEYATNIQVADLNALNAALAVVRWKKLFGFYLDFESEHNSTYSIDTNSLINDDDS
ncbi:MAG: ThiF family adenylyltransferase [Actinomycetota bacterium]